VLRLKGTYMADIAAELAKLRRFSRGELLEKWRDLYGCEAPHIRRELMIPFLAYKIQEDALGGLKASTRAELHRIARAMEARPEGANLNLGTRPRPGTRIVRHWQGQAHEVLVTEAGFDYRGTNYTSLSPIARRITGTQWSGPAFFGLRKCDRTRLGS